MNEFEIIKKYFAKNNQDRADIICGIGDDAALLDVSNDKTMVVTTDTLIESIHFPKETSAFDIGYKSLAVNLSDIAAMGGTPTFASLALTLPNQEKEWIKDFSQGFFSLAKAYQTALIGGDLTHGPLSITITLLGFVPKGSALLRANAKPGDLIYVTGTLGDAGLALRIQQGKNVSLDKLNKDDHSFLLERLNRPSPRVKAGQIILNLAHAAIDISDGLAADLKHLLSASKVGANVFVDKIPLSLPLQQSLSKEDAIKLALCAGDDYELCFTIPKEKQIELENKLTPICPFTCIGMIVQEHGLNLYYQDGSKYHGKTTGYQHF